MKPWMIVGALALSLASAPATFGQTFPSRLYAVKIAVQDFERSTRFYELLGMKAGRRHNEAEWELTWGDPGDGSAIIMVQKAAASGLHVSPGGASLVITIPSVQDAVARLRAAGFSVPGEPHVTPASSIFRIQDPDGNWIELAGPGSGPAPHSGS